jgi:Fe-S-cluster containining protein
VKEQGQEMTSTESPCKMCGECCHFEIPVTLLDIHRMANYLDMADKQVFDEYVQDKASSQSSLFMIRKNEERACVLLTADNRCTIHKAKPHACRFYTCTQNSGKDVLPWTATRTDPAERAELWEQSVAAVMTKAYIRENGATWNDSDYWKAIFGIYDNIVISDTQKIRLARNRDGAALAMIYNCSQCEKRGICANETPITLDDIRRITGHLRLPWKAFFRDKIAPEPSIHTGGLKLIRGKHCIFFHPGKHCTIEKVRPMHCLFTPCPRKTKTDEVMDCLFLGSGTVEQQFRHQVALAMTRQYVAESGVTYNQHLTKKLLETIDQLVSDRSEVERFCKKIAPYRYVDDTLTITRYREKT